MPDQITQADQQAAIATKLGDDAVTLRTATVREYLGRPYSIVVDLSQASPDKPLDPKDLIGSNATLRLKLPGSDEPRYWNGQIIDLDYAGQADDLPVYRITIAPRLYFLGRTADFRAAQGKAVPDIVQEILKDHGLTSVKMDLHGTYQPWDYCVQYRETDMNFITRLMEQEGIYYYFKHENGKHTLTITDEAASHKANADYDTLTWRPGGGGGDDDSEYVADVTLNHTVQPDNYTTSDYDFRTPRKKLISTASSDSNHGAGSFDVFDFPGEWDKDADGEHFTKIRLEELQAQRETITATTNARGLAAGSVIKIEGHPNPLLNRKFLVTSVDLSFSNNATRTGGDDDGDAFSCSFTAIDANTQFRTPRSAPKPVVQGPQTAVVVGPAGSEIHTDEFGRVKIQFHWDRYGKGDEKSSFWCRVGQSWAGRNWGTMFMPRVGMEVIVSFLEGDPDQPLITGCLYNGDNTPPYKLPDHATISTIKSNSSTGGAGFNEICFEDKKGKEYIFVHGEKDVHLRVKEDVHQTIGSNLHIHVGASHYEYIYADRHVTVDGNEYYKTTGEWHQLTKDKWNQKIEKQMSLEVVGDVAETFGANHHEKVTGDFWLNATGKIVIESAANITLKVGGSFISIGQAGITIETPAALEQKGLTVKVNADTNLNLAGGVMAELKSAMTSVKGDAMLVAKGGIVMIN